MSETISEIRQSKPAFHSHNSPITITLSIRLFQFGQLHCYLGCALHVGLHQGSIGRHTLPSAELFYLGQYKGCIITSLVAFHLRQMKGFVDDAVHIFFGDGLFDGHRVGEQETRQHGKLGLRV